MKKQTAKARSFLSGPDYVRVLEFLRNPPENSELLTLHQVAGLVSDFLEIDVTRDHVRRIRDENGLDFCRKPKPAPADDAPSGDALAVLKRELIRLAKGISMGRPIEYATIVLDKLGAAPGILIGEGETDSAKGGKAK